MPDRDFRTLLAGDFCPVNFRWVTLTWDSFWLQHLWQARSWLAVNGSRQRCWAYLTESLVERWSASIAEGGSWTSYQTTWRQVSHGICRRECPNQLETGKANPRKRSSALVLQTKCLSVQMEPPNYREQGLGEFFVLFYGMIISGLM